LLLTQVLAQEAALLSRYSLQSGSMKQWRLPERLNEISGLALDADDRLFAIADEQAVIYELDVEAGRLLKAFAFGRPAERADIEGIAIFEETFYLVDSDGVIYAGREAGDGESTDFEKFATRLGRECEIEGLAANPVARRLLIGCKQGRRKSNRNDIAIYAWDIDSREVLPEATLMVPVRDIRRRINTDRVNPSGLAFDPETGHLLLVAARQRALIELLPDGRLLQALRLPLESRHRQPEGIERLRDGRLLIADEGGSHKARLAVYTADRQ
jgi:uncharacterized protein YjiK